MKLNDLRPDDLVEVRFPLPGTNEGEVSISGVCHFPAASVNHDYVLLKGYRALRFVLPTGVAEDRRVYRDRGLRKARARAEYTRVQ